MRQALPQPLRREPDPRHLFGRGRCTRRGPTPYALDGTNNEPRRSVVLCTPYTAKDVGKDFLVALPI